MTYHLSRNGQPTGTCSKDEATARYARGEILPTDLVWCEGMANWTPASQVFGAATPQPAAAPAAPTPLPPPVSSPQTLPRPVAGDVGRPPNYLVWAILATIFCCIPFGIVAIVFAAQVDSKWSKGDTAGAEQASRNAKTWCWVTAGTGLALNVIGTAVYMFLVMGAVAASGGY